MRRCLIDDPLSEHSVEKVDVGECLPAAVSISVNALNAGVTSTITWRCVRCHDEWSETKPFEQADMELVGIELTRG